MKRVAVIGAGQTTFGLFPEATLKQLMADAARDAFKSVEKGLPPEDVDEVFVGSLSTGGSQLGNFAPLMVEAADGRAMPGTELAIYDDTRTRILPPGEIGELATRGPHVALGYFNDPERTASTFSPDGWLFSNDLATIDSDGYMRIVGRKKDIINRGGLKIAAREIEELFLEYPAVAQVALIPLPDERLGERACACLVTREGADVTFAALASYLSGLGVAKYKLPEFMVILDQLPTTPSGKIQMFQLQNDIVTAAIATSPPYKSGPTAKEKQHGNCNCGFQDSSK